MSTMSKSKVAAFSLSLLMGTMFTPISATAQTSDDEELGQDIIVTGSMIRQGGAQDIKHFRSVALDGSFLPQAADFTVEGLLGEHNLALPSNRVCKQMFCLTGAAIPAALPTRPADQWFIGLGFDSNIDSDSWKRAPVSLIAVVDRSGSMTGQPIAKVKEGLKEALAHMGKGDRIGIVLYGSSTEVRLPVTDVEGNREAIAKAIDSIDINGSTYMEAGLKLGYGTAFAELEKTGGKTRLMLFTDENPNVGNVSPEGFMGLAIAGSRKGVGLTTIGVGVHFDGALATKVSSVRGGNLFFLDPAKPAKELYDSEFRNMVSEVAHDIAITLTPPKGWKVSGVFGVPDGLLEDAGEGAVTVKIGTAFLSSNGGGIYAALAPDASRANLPAASLESGSPLLSVSLGYVDAIKGKQGSDTLTITSPSAEPAPALAKAQILVDEYLSVTKALTAYNRNYDKKAAFHLLDGLSGRLAASSIPGLGDERKMVDGLRDRAALVAGYRGEVPKELRPMAVLGRWKVIGQQGMEDIARGDFVEINDDEEFITYRKSGRAKGDEINQDIKLNEKQLMIEEENLVFNYRRNGDRLSLVTDDGLGVIRLRLITQAEEAQIDS